MDRMPDFDSLYQQHGIAVLRYLRSKLSSDYAEDLLQETFVQAMQSRAQMKSVKSPRAWLIAIARHLALNQQRVLRRSEALREDLAQSAPAADARLDAMRDAIAQLSPVLREALEFRLRDGLSYEEIADVLAIPVGTVRSRLHHALRELKQRLT
jgi:RNA polymerase sigma-70 factor (ECF subfamily)